MRVLIVEGRPHAGQRPHRHVEREGYVADTVQTAEHADADAEGDGRRHRPHIGLPGMDGFTGLKRFRGAAAEQGVIVSRSATRGKETACTGHRRRGRLPGEALRDPRSGWLACQPSARRRRAIRRTDRDGPNIDLARKRAISAGARSTRRSSRHARYSNYLSQVGAIRRQGQDRRAVASWTRTSSPNAIEGQSSACAAKLEPAGPYGSAPARHHGAISWKRGRMVEPPV